MPGRTFGSFDNWVLHKLTQYNGLLPLSSSLQGYNKTMVLSPQEESLISVVRALPPDEAGKVLDWARQLADLAGGRTVQWSDSWTDEDLAEATAAALRRFEDQEREDR
jgi:hypothetical protein